MYQLTGLMSERIRRTVVALVAAGGVVILAAGLSGLQRGGGSPRPADIASQAAAARSSQRGRGAQPAAAAADPAAQVGSIGDLTPAVIAEFGKGGGISIQPLNIRDLNLKLSAAQAEADQAANSPWTEDPVLVATPVTVPVQRGSRQMTSAWLLSFQVAGHPFLPMGQGGR